MQGKIVKGIAGFYYVHVPDKGIYECKAKGIFRKDNQKPLVGDDVEIQILDEEEGKGNIEERNAKKVNEEIDSFAEKFEKHSTNLTEFADKVNKNVENIEIMPIGNYVLCKQFDENPFQRIVRDSKSGLILDLGGMKPEYKNTDNGQIEEEEQFIKVGVIQEVGPECKWCQPGDTIFYTKPSAVPVPFYKQGLQLVCENRVLAVVNEGLTERFSKCK